MSYPILAAWEEIRSGLITISTVATAALLTASCIYIAVGKFVPVLGVVIVAALAALVIIGGLYLFVLLLALLFSGGGE